MLKKVLVLALFFGLQQLYAQECPTLTNPLNGSTNVPINTVLNWDEVIGVTGYIISIGTTDGGTEIINRVNVGDATSFMPPLGLPETTEIFVTISLFFLNRPEIRCDTESFFTEDVTTVPDCTRINNIENGATDVSVFTDFSWNFALRATSYNVRAGTAPGLNDIADVDLNALSFDVPGQLPENTLIYVTITAFNENGDAVNCEEIVFETGALAVLPECTMLISPFNGETNVALTPLIEWEDIPEATGYRVTIGTSPTSTNILENTVFTTNSTLVIDFEPNRTFFITIIAFNEAGDAIGCSQESFSTVLGCGPFFDPVTNELVTLNPEIEFNSIFTICESDSELELTAPNVAMGYRWFGLSNLGAESLITETQTITITEIGQYRLEAFDIISGTGSSFECSSFVDFEVVSSEDIIIDNLAVSENIDGLEVAVQINSIGDFEYAIDNIEGPYQDSNIFTGLSFGTHTVYVRDTNGCVVTEETFTRNTATEGFPNFFTPNGDGINDFWQFIQTINRPRVVFQSIRIYNRFGKLLAQIDPQSLGWDGNYNGRQLPSGGYWYSAVDDMNQETQGFFTLKR